MNKPIPERVEEFKKEFWKLSGDSVTELDRKQDEYVQNMLTETDQQARDEEKESKDSAYRERNMLVCALTKLFPAYLARHDESDESWERDWMWIVYIDLPTGQVSWHIHDSEFTKFSHLEIKENNWDGHNTERKYQRLLALSALSNPPSQV